MTQVVNRIARNDVKVIGRDSFLTFMFIFAGILAVVLRFGVPWLNNYLLENNILNEATFITSLTETYPMLVAYGCIYIGSLMVGTIFGFMLLDEKDDNTIKAMMVTPVSLNQYVTYRVGTPIFIAFVIVLGMILIFNQAILEWWQVLIIVAGGSLNAPIVSLFYAGFAANKVQGFAYSKFVSLAGWLILGGFFVPEPFQFLLGFFPPFWIAKSYWLAFDGNTLWMLTFVIGVVTQLGLIYWLVKRFNRMAYR